MLQPNIPRKTSAMIQVWVSFVLVLACLIMSLMPIIKLETADSTETIEEFVSEIGGKDITIPHEIDISAVDLIKSTGLMFNVISVAADSDNSEKVQKLEEKLESESGQKSLLIAISMVNSITDSFEEEEAAEDDDTSSSKTSALETVISILIVICVIFGVFGLTIVLPIYFIIAAIKALIPALKHRKDPENATAAVSKQLSGALMFPLLLMLFQSIIPGMSYGAGTLGLLIIAIISAAMNTVVSRLTQYTMPQFKYLNVLQGASVVGIVGYLVFFFNILKTNIFSSFVHGKLFDYIQYAIDKKEYGKNVEELAKRAGTSVSVTYNAENGYLIGVVLFVVYVLLIISSIAFLSSAVNRLSCSSQKKSSLLVSAVLTLPVYIIPVYLTKATYKYPTFAEENLESLFDTPDPVCLLNLNGEQTSALTAALVGIIIMIVAEVALFVLEKVLCNDTTAEEKNLIASGAIIANSAAPAAEETAKAEETVEEAVETATEAEAPVEVNVSTEEAEENKETSESEVQQ